MAFCAASMARMASHNSLRLHGSSPAVGSSSSNRRGAPTRLALRSSLRRLPPEYVRTGRSAASVSLSCSIMAALLARAARLLCPKRRATISRFSRPVMASSTAALNEAMAQLVADAVFFNQAVAEALHTNLTDLQCLGILRSSGPMLAGRLAELSGLSTGTITGVVNRLEAAGFVAREPDEHDRRRVIVRPLLDEIGRRIAPLYVPISKALLEMCERYSDEQLALIVDFVSTRHTLNPRALAELRELAR